MIELGLSSSGCPEIRQRSVSPVVYLDHWAFRAISGDASLSDRFVTALRARNGTLAISWVGVIEFATVESAEQHRMAEDFLQAVFPSLFFLEVNPFFVVGREDELLAGGPQIAPHADPDPLRFLPILDAQCLAPLSVRGLLNGLRDPELITKRDVLGHTFIHQVEEMRTAAAVNPSLAGALRSIPVRPEVEVGTRWLIREYLRPLVSDCRKKVSTHDAMDYFHAVVPVAYCDYVLLDRHWAAQTTQIRSRLEEAKLTFPIATVFTGRRAVEQLLELLELGDI